MDKVAGKNINKPILEVYHRSLRRHTDSVFRSECPICGLGILPVLRDQLTGIIIEKDRCMLCGQAYRYMDVEILQKAELILEESLDKKTKKRKELKSWEK